MLQLDRLTRQFGDHLAVNDVSFEVADGLMTGFVGGNGAGKTTTMRIIMGVLSPTSGSVRWNGAELDNAARRRFGYMPEERGLYPKQPVLNQLVYLGRLQGLSAPTAKRSAETLLERFSLTDRGGGKLEELSLGNQQRVQIAAAVIGEPEVLILDEPFSGLDPVAVDSMVDLLREYTTRGVPVLFSSHQLDLVERLCDRLAILSSGTLVGWGTVEELRRRGAVRHRLVLDSDAGWIRDFPDIHVIDVDGATAIVELPNPAAGNALLSHALAKGGVREFAEIVPNLSEIYREVTA